MAYLHAAYLHAVTSPSQAESSRSPRPFGCQVREQCLGIQALKTFRICVTLSHSLREDQLLYEIVFS